MKGIFSLSFVKLQTKFTAAHNKVFVRGAFKYVFKSFCDYFFLILQPKFWNHMDMWWVCWIKSQPMHIVCIQKWLTSSGDHWPGFSERWSVENNGLYSLLTASDQRWIKLNLTFWHLCYYDNWQLLWLISLQAGLWKNWISVKQWKDDKWAMEEPIQIWWNLGE